MSGDTATLSALLTVSETARLLSCSPATVRRMLDDGSLEPVRLRQVAGGSVRVRAADVRRLVDHPPEATEARRRTIATTPSTVSLD